MWRSVLTAVSVLLGITGVAKGSLAEETTPREAESAPAQESTIRGRALESPEAEGRAASSVSRRIMQERLPRSAPDALKYEPGTSVQQTAHGQASAFIRGLTGQQTVLLFDGIRLNNATFRQGPNQYFFTVDSSTVASLVVTRGSASVVYGSDALGGAINAIPLEPRLVASDRPLRLLPRTRYRLSTSDDERGGRFEVEAQVGRRVGWLAGVGYRTLGLLEGGGIVRSPRTGEPARVPRLAADRRTQLGTGFDELTFDQRLVVDLGAKGRLLAAAYGYRQFDAPRTDQCPAPYAPYNECLTYEEQFRTLAYVAYEGQDLTSILGRLRLTLSYQQQHEKRRLDRPNSSVVLTGVDDDHVAGVTLALATPGWRPLSWLQLDLRSGADLYADFVRSRAATTFTDLELTFEDSRGLYVDGSRALTSGLYAEGRAFFPFGFSLRLGGRLAFVLVHSPPDQPSDTLAVDAWWCTPVGRLGLEWHGLDWLTLVANVDQGVRAPNLNDLTTRQQTGPGFQYENAHLDPEQSLTVEGGVLIDSAHVRASAFLFSTTLLNAMVRALRTTEDCPDSASQCRNSWSRFQLVNVDEPSRILGAEFLVYVRLPWGFALRATLAAATGAGPNPGAASSTSAAPRDRVPLSRIPPLNGTVEARWQWSRVGVFAGAGLRWALAQDRLAPSDMSDERIPEGGTPGFAVLDLRAGYRLNRQVLLAMVFENITDVAYRSHGSSINGPGRGLLFYLELGL